jgi:hypothetical protein
MQLLKKGLRILLWPFRFWRLMLVGLLLLATAHIIIDQVLLRKLAAQTEQFRKEGRPVTYADLKLPEYKPIDNANTVYEQAMDMIKKQPEEASWERYGLLVGRYVSINPCVPRNEEQPLSAEEFAELGGYLHKLQPALDLLRSSRDCGKCIIPDALSVLDSINNENETVSVSLSSLSWMRELTRYAGAKGLWEYRQGNGEAAFDWFALGLNIADNHKAHPTLIGELNRIGCIAIVLDAVQQALHEGEVPAAFPAVFTAELQKCIDRSICARALENERVYSNEASERMGLQAWRVMRPLYSFDLLKMNQLFLELSDTLKNPDVSRQEAVLKRVRQWSKDASRLYIMTKDMAPMWLSSVHSIRRGMSLAGMCDTAIKLKQFKQKNGAYPDSLSELAQPLSTDPFLGRDFNYKRDADGFVLSSAGKTFAYRGKTHTETNISWCAVR